MPVWSGMQPVRTTHIHCVCMCVPVCMHTLALSFQERGGMGIGKWLDGKTWELGGENTPIVLLKIPKDTGTWLLRGRLCSHWRHLGEQRSCEAYTESEKVRTVGKMGPFWKR